MKIVASYDAPSTFTLDPPSYRAASPLTLTCEVQGVDDYLGLYYQWSSTCSGNCFVRTGFQSVGTLSTPHLHSYDTGVHTCTVYAFGIVGSASISINVVGKNVLGSLTLFWNSYQYLAGAGIFVPAGSKVLSNNSLITTISPSLHFIPSFHCLSGSSQSRVGNLIGPLGTVITFSTSDPFHVTRGGSHDPGSLSVFSVRQIGSNDTGIYTYLTPDEKGEMLQFHFGIYLLNNTGNSYSHHYPLLPYLLELL